MPRKKKATEKKTKKDEMISEDLPFFVIEGSEKPAPPKLRTIGLYGEIEEEKVGELTYAMLALTELGKKEIKEDPEDFNSKTIKTEYMPFEFYISTWGGSAADMFALYDTMKLVREKCEIRTVGMGKVMSAGVLLLAAGTKGNRKIGENCRVMLHSVIGGQYGPIHNLENEMDEIRWIQEQHIKALVKETDMTERYLKKLLNRKVNVYLTAKEAVELGIADEII